jgi:hypothetical protein
MAFWDWCILDAPSCVRYFHYSHIAQGVALELSLVLQNFQVNVWVNGKESHQFSLLDLSPSSEDQKAFFKNPGLAPI